MAIEGCRVKVNVVRKVSPRKVTNSTQTLPALRQHQKDAMAAICKVIRRGEGRGRIVLPTGTGKTRIEAETVYENIQHQKLNWSGVHVVLSPRILLAYQQLNEFITFIGSKGVRCNYMVVNSGGLDSTKYERKLLRLGFDHPEEIDSTTSIQLIVENIQKAKKDMVPLLIFSTYHSAGQVNSAATITKEKIQSYVFDEAQYCVTSGDFKNVPKFDSYFKFFFTATEKLTSPVPTTDGLGMQNEEIFGKVLFTEKPKTLIERGEMASVAIHLVGTRGQDVDDNDYESMARVVIEGFDKHRIVMKSHSAKPEYIGPKMVVVCDKQDSLRGIMRSKVLKAYKMLNQQVNLCALSSDFGIEVNGEFTPRANNKNKEALLAKMKNWKMDEESIIFHVDMISEGLDVSGITAIMPFRNLCKIKFLQNIGRGTRLVDIDRAQLYSKAISPKEWSKYVKPYCWLVLPVLSAEYYDMKRRYTYQYIYPLRSDYGFSSSDIVVIDNIVGPPEDKPVEDMVGGVDRNLFTGKGMIEEIIHGIEDGEAMSEFMDHVFSFNTLSPAKQLAMLRDIYAV